MLMEEFFSAMGAIYFVLSIIFFGAAGWGACVRSTDLERMKYCVEKKVSPKDCASYYEGGR